MSRLDLTLEAKASVARRIEVITGGGGSRRRWSEEEKAQAVEASLEPDAVVSAVARQYGVTPQQLFTWRREARLKAEKGPPPEAFVPVVIEPAATPVRCPPQGENEPATAHPHSIELDVEGSSVWIWPGADAAMVTTIIGALKASK